MKIKVFLKKKIPWLILTVGIFLSLITFARAKEPAEKELTLEKSYTRTEYGLWRNDSRLLYLGAPEEMGVVWCVVAAFDGSGPVYRYFENETDAWTFYSMLRMTLATEEPE